MEPLDFGEGMKNIYALHEDTEIIAYNNGEVNLAAHAYGNGRCVYIAGLPYSTQNTRILLRALYHAAGKRKRSKNGMRTICTARYMHIRSQSSMQF